MVRQWHKGLFTGIQLNGARGVIPAPPCDWYASVSVGEVAGSRFFYSLNALNARNTGEPKRSVRLYVWLRLLKGCYEPFFVQTTEGYILSFY